MVLGPQDDEFDDAEKALFLDSDWKISATSDRMGYRLEGPVTKHLHGHNIVSDGTVDGNWSRIAGTSWMAGLSYEVTKNINVYASTSKVYNRNGASNGVAARSNGRSRWTPTLSRSAA